MGSLNSLLGGWTDYQGFCTQFIEGLLGITGVSLGSECGIFYALFWRSGVDELIFGGFSGFDRFLVDFWLNFGQIFKFDNSLCLFPYYVFFSGGSRV